MDYRNHTQDHSVDIQKLTQDQKDLIAIVILIFGIFGVFCFVFVFLFYLDRSSRNVKIIYDHSEPEDMLLDPKERIMVQNLRACGLF